MWQPEIVVISENLCTLSFCPRSKSGCVRECSGQFDEVITRVWSQKTNAFSRLNRSYLLFLAWACGPGVYLNPSFFWNFPVWLSLSKGLHLIWQAHILPLYLMFITPQINTWWSLFATLGRPSVYLDPRLNWGNLVISILWWSAFSKTNENFPTLRNTSS